jgi:hypothetical protein
MRRSSMPKQLEGGKRTPRQRLHDSLRKEGLGMRAKGGEKGSVKGKRMRPEESAEPKRERMKLKCGGVVRKSMKRK